MSPTNAIFRRFLPALLFAFLMAWGLPSRGLRVYDEGHFLMAAETVRLGGLSVLRGAPLAETSQQIHQIGGTLYFAAKPGWILELAVFGFLTGGVTDWRALLLSALCGIFTICLIESVVRRRWGPTASFAAAMLLATNPLYVGFARTALGVAPAIFWFVLSWWLLEKGVRWGALLSGVSAFLSFACHYNMVPVILALAIVAWPRHTKRDRALGIAGFGLAALILEGFLTLVDMRLAQVQPEFRSFLGELRHNFLEHQVQSGRAIPAATTDGVRGFGIDSWAFVFRVLIAGFHWQLPLAIAGLFWLRKRNHLDAGDWRQLAILFLLPLGFWLLYPWKVERSFATLSPIIAIIAALLLSKYREEWIAASGARPGGFWRTLADAPLAAVLATGLLALMPELQEKSPYRRAVTTNESWIAKAPEGSFTARSFHWRSVPLWKWYLGPERFHHELPMQAVNFASFEEPLVFAVDEFTSEPDPSFLLQSIPATKVYHIGNGAGDSQQFHFVTTAQDFPAPFWEVDVASAQ